MRVGGWKKKEAGERERKEGWIAGTLRALNPKNETVGEGEGARKSWGSHAFVQSHDDRKKCMKKRKGKGVNRKRLKKFNGQILEKMWGQLKTSRVVQWGRWWGGNAGQRKARL